MPYFSNEDMKSARSWDLSPVWVKEEMEGGDGLTLREAWVSASTLTPTFHLSMRISARNPK